MTKRVGCRQLTNSLEDYLETVYELVRDKGFARVKDIAQARDVRPGSVSPAMRRLADMGLIEYVRREYISLTPEGEERARRVVARHQVLCRLFEDVLQMESSMAEAEACAMEHSLSDEAMDRLVRFFEFLRLCPDAETVLARFHDCRAMEEERSICNEYCIPLRRSDRPEGDDTVRLDELRPGEGGRVAHITGQGPARQRLLDMGIMPDVELEVDRIDPQAETFRVRIGGFVVSLSAEEAASVVLHRDEH